MTPPLVAADRASPAAPAQRSMVLHVLSTVEDGAGMTRAAVQLASATAAGGVQVEMTGPLLRGRPACTVDGTQEGLFEIVPIPHGPGPARHLIVATAVRRRLAALANERKAGHVASVVHVHGVWMPANVVAWSACIRHGIPYVVSPHGMLLAEALARSRWRKRAIAATVVRRGLERARAVHVTSDAEVRAVMAIAPRARPVLIPWGVQLPPSDATERARGLVAGYLGRILPIKGVDLLVDAWAAIRPAGWRLRLVGADPEGYATLLRRRIHACGLDDRVTIEPPLASEQTADFLERIGLLVLPSRSENFGLVVAEALGAGTPVLTTSATPWQQVVEQNAGWIVAPSVTDLADGLRLAVATSPLERQAMGHRGRLWMERTSGWGVVIGRFLRDLYDLADVAPCGGPPCRASGLPTPSVMARAEGER